MAALAHFWVSVHESTVYEASAMLLLNLFGKLCLFILSIPEVASASPNSKQSKPEISQYDEPSSTNFHTPHGKLSERQSTEDVSAAEAKPCKVHLIAAGDTCDAIARHNKVTIRNLERWNKKTWAWTSCENLMLSYTMCISDGNPPLPPPQEGVECGPMKPGTQPPPPGVALNELNPCPLNACCSNWGFCGVFPQHCDVHAPKGGGPGSLRKGFSSTCVSNCGMQIKKNSGAAPSFQRIGYFESFGMDRKCLRMSAKDANTDGSYTHMHWAFGLIDPHTWRPIINESHREQWKEFKALPNMKRIISFGGWAYSTEADTYGILREAIIQQRDLFTTNLARFVEDEGVDGIDIDWEYPGAPDITVNNQVIGQKDDGSRYLEFLRLLKVKLGEQSVSIAAPASYWYLKAFPIEKIIKAIDYIVYMTYDLHGQWDYGNPNAFDSCASGKCIRSHVNLTETTNALAMITKAGVENNKIFVGEASYGRSFHMQDPNCRGSNCDFTGSRIKSNALPGRCTETSGYISYAELTELLFTGDGVEAFHDGPSNTDVMLHKGDYISYMTPDTKETRRTLWKSHNFAGTIDWAVDLQSFTSMDANDFSDRPASGDGCVSGSDTTLDSDDLCEFTCALGFCPEPLCFCSGTGELDTLPDESNRNISNIIAFDETNVNLNRVCKFACKYGYCPEQLCSDKPEGIESIPEPQPNMRDDNANRCFIYQRGRAADHDDHSCQNTCNALAPQDGQSIRSSTCLGTLDYVGEPPWVESPTGEMVLPGECKCDIEVINVLAEIFMEALPAIAQINCYVFMSTFNLVLTTAGSIIPVGRIANAALDALTTAAQMATYVYDETQNPEEAFSWWLSPCGGDDLVPEDLKTAFDILNTVADGASSFRKPTKIGKGSGKKGDAGNPKDRSTPRAGSGVNSGRDGNSAKRQRKCFIKAGEDWIRKGPASNTLQSRSCNRQDQTITQDWVVTSITYGPTPTAIAGHCSNKWSQACYHYSSAIRVNPQWATLTCPEAAATTAYRGVVANVNNGPIATKAFSSQHRGKGWLLKGKDQPVCDRDEYPPAYLIDPKDDAWKFSGIDARGQLVRYVDLFSNRGAANEWKSVCFKPLLEGLTNKEFQAAVEKDQKAKPIKDGHGSKRVGSISVQHRPEFHWGTWGHAANPPPNDGLDSNPCWNKKDAPLDPGQALLTYDPWYEGKAPPYDYTKPV